MEKKIGIMQPYFLPYIGYWQLINYVDEFVLYDNIKYTKKGWINRNRYLSHNEETLFSLPIRSASDSLLVYERDLSENFERQKMIRQFSQAYKKAPFYKDNFHVFEEIIEYPHQNLFEYIKNSIFRICDFLEIKTKIVISSSIDIAHKELKAQDKVIELCKARRADIYINPIGGVDLYNKSDFLSEGIELHFLRANSLEYNQSLPDHIAYLSILDVLMFNSREQVKKYLSFFRIE